ncbi:C-C motif chemokine 5-like [Podarcis muralis]
MKVSIAGLTFLLLLLVSLSLTVAAQRGMDASPCCPRYNHKPFPRSIVKSFFRTSSHCNRPAVVFVFRNGKSGCADPKAEWVKKLMASLTPE